MSRAGSKSRHARFRFLAGGLVLLLLALVAAPFHSHEAGLRCCDMCHARAFTVSAAAPALAESPLVPESAPLCIRGCDRGVSADSFVRGSRAPPFV